MKKISGILKLTLAVYLTVGAMLAMIARQPLVKLLQQAGIDPKGETAQQLNAALSRIPKNR